MTRLVRQFGRKQEGAVAIEFAILALPFIWLLLIVFEAAANQINMRPRLGKTLDCTSGCT